MNPVLTSAACRTFVSNAMLRDKLQQTAKPPVEQAPPGADAIHIRKDVSPANESKDMAKGDWLLFHPVYSHEELTSIEHHTPTTTADRIAASFVDFCKWSFDFASGYKHKPIPADPKFSLAELRKQGFVMDEKQWLRRILFLESVAGVPGMVAAMLPHLQSLRLMRRDGGWIHTLLEEAENERMHLMVFMTLKKPSLFFRLVILCAQGVFNAFLLAYTISPKMSHRFVGYLEEAAVATYTLAIQDLEKGYIPEETKPAPGIAVDYWRLRSSATMRDVLYAVRSDETTHRFINHSFANLERGDANPFALGEPGMGVKGKVIEFDRAESERYLKEKQQRWEGASEATQRRGEM